MDIRSHLLITPQSSLLLNYVGITTQLSPLQQEQVNGFFLPMLSGTPYSQLQKVKDCYHQREFGLARNTQVIQSLPIVLTVQMAVGLLLQRMSNYIIFMHVLYIKRVLILTFDRVRSNSSGMGHRSLLHKQRSLKYSSAREETLCHHGA